MILNYVKLRVCTIGQLEKDFVMEKSTSISSVANTIKKMHTQSDFHLIFKKNLYCDKQNEMDEFLMNTVFPY